MSQYKTTNYGKDLRKQIADALPPKTQFTLTTTGEVMIETKADLSQATIDNLETILGKTISKE